MSKIRPFALFSEQKNIVAEGSIFLSLSLITLLLQLNKVTLIHV